MNKIYGCRSVDPLYPFLVKAPLTYFILPVNSRKNFQPEIDAIFKKLYTHLVTFEMLNYKVGSYVWTFLPISKTFSALAIQCGAVCEFFYIFHFISARLIIFDLASFIILYVQIKPINIFFSTYITYSTNFDSRISLDTKKNGKPVLVENSPLIVIVCYA